MLQIGTLVAVVIQDWVREERQGWVCLSIQVKDDNFIQTFFQPWGRQIECSLGADFPKASQRFSVDKDLSLAERAGIDKGVGRLVYLKGCLIKAGTHARG